MIETEEKEICGSIYLVTQMPAMRALKMQARLLRLIGPSFGAMIASGEDSSIPVAINLLAEKLDENTYEKIILDLLQGVRKDGVELTKGFIDLAFAGNLNELYRVIQFVLEVNFADFFQEGGIIAELRNAAELKKTISPNSKKT